MNLDLFSRSILSNASAAYTALQGNLAATQTANDTIDKLVDRLQNGQLMEDRRASLLGLKALARDWKADVAKRAFPSLLTVLVQDAPQDVECAKACLETLIVLCESDLIEEEGQHKPQPLPKGQPDVGLVNTDLFLANPEPLHSLLALLSVQHFYVRFFTLQMLSTLLQNRPPKVQDYVLTSPGGVRTVMECLEEKREILRNEALLLLHNLTVTNGDLQKIVAFEGAFERLFDIVFAEGGIEGGVVVQDCLAAIGTLLRFNSSNSNYFRELSQIPRLPPLLFFPSPPPPSTVPAPDEFALQYWPEQKVINAGLVIGIAKLLVMGGNPGGNQQAMLSSGMTRCLLELAMSSNAPAVLKAQALSTLTSILHSSRPNQDLLSTLITAPLVLLPPDESEGAAPPEHGPGHTRLSPRPATVILVSLAVHGEHPTGSAASSEGWSGVGLRLRKAAVGCFEAYLSSNREGAEGIVGTMRPPPENNPNDPTGDVETPQSAGSLLLSALTDLPVSGEQYDPYRPILASLLFAHLLRTTETIKKMARAITFPSADEDDDEDPQTLVGVVVGNLVMAAREQTEVANREAKDGVPAGGWEMTGRDWSRAQVGWLLILCQWLWDSPKTVKEFLSEGSHLQVLIQPIVQSSGVDPLIQGLSAFLLGVCYEFNREPGEITRSTLHPILHSRIGPDQFVSRMARLRDDPRFKAVGPELVEEDDVDDSGLGLSAEEMGEVWFDWAFVEFWKNTYYTIQRSINADPESSTRPADADSESAALINSLRARVKSQAEELEALQTKLGELTTSHATTVKELTNKHDETLATLTSTHDSKLGSVTKELEDKVASLTKDHEDESKSIADEISSLNLSVATLTSSLAAAQKKHADDEKEQEDLLVLLEELSAKRKRDKARMREAGLDVSEDEEDGGDDDEEDSEEE